MRLHLLAGLSVLALSAASTAHAAVITLSATEAEYRRFEAGTSFAQAPSFTLGEVGLESQFEYRYTLQFNLAALPADATVTQATLRLRDALGASNIFGYGFVGNGTFSAASVTTGTQLFQTPAGNFGAVNYDVTGFVDGLSAGAYAGFSLRQMPLGGQSGIFAINGFILAPLLTITYTQPTPPPTAAPEPASLALLSVGVLGLAMVRRRRTEA